MIETLHKKNKKNKKNFLLNCALDELHMRVLYLDASPLVVPCWNKKKKIRAWADDLVTAS
jgi:hypothetical protein